MTLRTTSLLGALISLCGLAAMGCGDDGDTTGSGGTGATGGTTTTGGSGGAATGGTGGTATGGTGGTATGGSGGSGGTGGSAPIAVSLTFQPRVGAEAFDCAAAYTGVGSTAATIHITDFRLYVHDVALHQADGTLVPVTLEQDGLWQYQNVALLDFENGAASCANGTPETNTTLVGTAPAGDYDGVVFKVGVPFELNHGDVAVAPSPLNLSAMFWNWNGGYKFLRVDSLAEGAPMAFNLHLGSTGCLDDGNGGVSSCDRPNRPEVALTGFDPLTTPIVVDYAAVVAASDILVNGGGAPGCMSGTTDPECGAIFERLGIDLADGSIHPETQTLFATK